MGRPLQEALTGLRGWVEEELGQAKKTDQLFRCLVAVATGKSVCA